MSSGYSVKKDSYSLTSSNKFLYNYRVQDADEVKLDEPNFKWISLILYNY